jgi:hypothetical protein
MQIGYLMLCGLLVETNPLQGVLLNVSILHRLLPPHGLIIYPCCCRCLLNIPHTLIFRDGFPIKALHTDRKGYIARLSLDNVSQMEREVSDRGLQGESNMELRSCRKLLLEYSQVNDYVHGQEDEDNPILCNVSHLSLPLPLSILRARNIFCFYWCCFHPLILTTLTHPLL